MCGHDVVIGVCPQRSCRGAHFGAVFLKHSVSLTRPENVTFLHRKAVHGVVVAPWGGAVVVLALADVRSLLGALPCNQGSASCASRLWRLMIFLCDGAEFYLTKVRKSAGKIFLWGF